MDFILHSAFFKDLVARVIEKEIEKKIGERVMIDVRKAEVHAKEGKTCFTVEIHGGIETTKIQTLLKKFGLL